MVSKLDWNSSGWWFNPQQSQNFFSIKLSNSNSQTRGLDVHRSETQSQAQSGLGSEHQTTAPQWSQLLTTANFNWLIQLSPDIQKIPKNYQKSDKKIENPAKSYVLQMSCKHFENPTKTDKSDIVAALTKCISCSLNALFFFRARHLVLVIYTRCCHGISSLKIILLHN